MNIELDTSSLKSLESKFATVDTNKFFIMGLTEAGKRVAKQYEHDIPKDTGAGAAGIVQEAGNGQITVRTKQDYLKYVVTGTKPHFPPIKSIEPWATRHGINPFALQKSIGKKGTKKNDFIKKVYDVSMPEAVKGFDNAMNALVTAMVRS